MVKELYPFQVIGRDFLVMRNNAILADDMGTGKNSGNRQDTRENSEHLEKSEF